MIENVWHKSRRHSTWIFGASRGFQPPGAGNAPAPDDRRFAPSPFSAFAPGTGLWFRAVFWIFLFLLTPRTDPAHAQLNLEKRLISEVENVSEGGILDFSLTLAVPPAEAPLSLRLADDLPTLDGLWEPVAARVTAVGEGLSGAALQPGDSGEFQDFRFGDGRPDRVVFDFGSVAVSEAAGETGANQISVEISAQAVSAVTPTLAHWWRLDEETGTAAAADGGAAAETRDGALVNMNGDAWIAEGKRGGGLRFDAGGDSGPGFVRLAEDGQLPLRPDQPYTISLWFRTTRPGALLAKAGGTPEERQVYLFVNSGPDSLQAFVGGVFFPLVDVNVRDGQWHLATLANDPAAGTATLYLDGGEDFATATPGDAVNPADVLLGVRREGNQNEGAAFAFTGDMDDVRLYDVALTAEDVRQLFRSENANRALAIFGDARAEATVPVAVIPADRTIALSGRVWADANRDGVRGADEGLSEILVRLAEGSGPAVETAVTGGDGAYQFADLAPGSWRIAVDAETLPTDLVPFQDPAGEADGVALLEDVASDRGNLDFGYRIPEAPPPPEPPPPPPAGGLSGRVWFDADGDGLRRDDESPAADVTVELRSRSGSAVVDRTRTGDGGRYRLTGISPGGYLLAVIPPTDFRLTRPDGDDPTRNSDFDPETGTRTVTVVDDIIRGNLDAGLIPDQIALSGRVWRDDDGNGEIAPAEGVSGVRLTARREGEGVLRATRTTADGRFEFAELSPGSWTLAAERATLPEFSTFRRAPDATADGVLRLPDATRDRSDLNFELVSTLTPQPADLTGSRILGVDGNGSPVMRGDELTFQVVLYNAGDRSAEDVVFSAETPEETILLPDTVDTDRGAVALDGAGGFRVFAGTLEPGGVAWIDWRATVRENAAAGAWVIAGGQVTAVGMPAVPVDAADTKIPDDPLVLGPIGGAGEAAAGEPPLVATQSVVPAGPVTPGERLRFEILLTATGGETVRNVRVLNAVPVWTELDPDSLSADRGIAEPGNPIPLSVDSMSPGETVRFRFDAVVRNDVPDHARIASQSLILARGVRARSDDPATAAFEDAAMVRTAGPSPALRLWVEAEERPAVINGGEPAVFFCVSVVNPGVEPVFGVRLFDALTGNVELLAGSVETEQGTVLRGNLPGDATVEVDVGKIPPGAAAAIRYRVKPADHRGGLFPFSRNRFLFFRNPWSRAEGIPDIRADDPLTPSAGDGMVLPAFTSVSESAAAKTGDRWDSWQGRAVGKPNSTGAGASACGVRAFFFVSWERRLGIVAASSATRATCRFWRALFHTGPP